MPSLIINPALDQRGGAAHIPVLDTLSSLATEQWQLLNYTASRSTNKMQGDRSYIYPFSFACDAKINEFAVDITTAGAADSACKFAIYEVDPVTGWGARRIATVEYTGATDWTSTGVKKMNFGADVQIERGKKYYFCLVTDTSASDRPTLRTGTSSEPYFVGTGIMLPMIPYASANFNVTAYAQGFFDDLTYATAYPDPMPVGAYDPGAIQWYIIGLRLTS